MFTRVSILLRFLPFLTDHILEERSLNCFLILTFSLLPFHSSLFGASRTVRIGSHRLSVHGRCSSPTWEVRRAAGRQLQRLFSGEPRQNTALAFASFSGAGGTIRVPNLKERSSGHHSEIISSLSPKPFSRYLSFKGLFTPKQKVESHWLLSTWGFTVFFRN